MKPIKTLTCQACGREFPAAMLVCRCDRDAPAPRTSGLAVAGAVFSVLFPLLGLFLAIAALGQIRGSGGQLEGSGLAVGAAVVSVLAMTVAISVALGAG